MILNAFKNKCFCFPVFFYAKNNSRPRRFTPKFYDRSFSQKPLHPSLLLKESDSITKNLRIAIKSLRIFFTENLIDCPVTILIQIVFFLRPLSFNDYDTTIIIIPQEYIRSSKSLLFIGFHFVTQSNESARKENMIIILMIIIITYRLPQKIRNCLRSFPLISSPERFHHIFPAVIVHCILK